MCVCVGGRSGRFQSPEAGQVSTGIDTLWGRVRGGGAPPRAGCEFQCITSAHRISMTEGTDRLQEGSEWQGLCWALADRSMECVIRERGNLAEAQSPHLYL